MGDGEKARCPMCEKVLTACNLNTHIKNVHMKVKTICQICDMEMPLNRMSHHRRVVHNIGQPKEVVIPRTPKLKSLLKMVQHRQAEEESTSLQEQVPVKAECEKFVEGDSTRWSRRSSLWKRGKGTTLTSMATILIWRNAPARVTSMSFKFLLVIRLIWDLGC